MTPYASYKRRRQPIRGVGASADARRDAFLPGAFRLPFCEIVKTNSNFFRRINGAISQPVGGFGETKPILPGAIDSAEARASCRPEAEPTSITSNHTPCRRRARPGDPDSEGTARQYRGGRDEPGHDLRGWKLFRHYRNSPYVPRNARAPVVPNIRGNTQNDPYAQALSLGGCRSHEEPRDRLNRRFTATPEFVNARSRVYEAIALLCLCEFATRRRSSRSAIAKNSGVDRDGG
jgi:hypothetical protein